VNHSDDRFSQLLKQAGSSFDRRHPLDLPRARRVIQERALRIRIVFAVSGVVAGITIVSAIAIALPLGMLPDREISPGVPSKIGDHAIWPEDLAALRRTCQSSSHNSWPHPTARRFATEVLEWREPRVEVRRWVNEGSELRMTLWDGGGPSAKLVLGLVRFGRCWVVDNVNFDTHPVDVSVSYSSDGSGDVEVRFDIREAATIVVDGLFGAFRQFDEYEATTLPKDDKGHVATFPANATPSTLGHVLILYKRADGYVHGAVGFTLPLTSE
jgi:hypothetical protein